MPYSSDALGNHEGILEDCDLILSINSQHHEGLYWRGSALFKCRKYQGLTSIECLKQAAESLERAITIGGAKKQACAEVLKRVKSEVKRQKKSEKNVYAKMFG